MISEPVNAEAGPSHSHSHGPLASPSSDFSMSICPPSSPVPCIRPPPAPTIPPLYLPPPGLPQPQTLLASTQDLISRFNLLPAYDKYVKQTIVPATNGASVPAVSDINMTDQSSHLAQGHSPSALGATPSVVGGSDKGKGKEKDVVMDGQAGMGMPLTGGSGVAGGTDDGMDKGEKKRKNTYKHLIKGIPGKHSMKKDDFLSTTMLIPPKQRIPITPFDARTQRDAFTVSLEGLKGWNIHTLILESPQAREDRKKRKELKRLAKAQVVALAAARQSGASAQNQSVPTTAQPRSQATVSSPDRIGAASTPKPGARPGVSTVLTPTPTPIKAEAHTSPRPSSAVPRPKPIVPRPGSTKPPITAGQTSTSTSGAVGAGTPLRSGTPMQVDQQRGTKRERDDTVVNGAAAGNGQGLPTTAIGTSMIIADAKAGVAGVRPRPIKKQRMDMQGQARDIAAPVQQPTPQGV
ncbi:hypothetical protein APHAL10511_007716 [Amanita phalloides]|nr:hypothetical protein APHAL10511_007716 [Amanita phalloides]